MSDILVIKYKRTIRHFEICQNINNEWCRIDHEINNKYHNMFSEFEQKLKGGESNDE